MFKSPFSRSLSERQQWLNKVLLEGENPFKMDENSSQNSKATDDKNMNNIFNANNSWSDLIQKAKQQNGPVIVRDNQILVEGNDQASAIAMVGLKKCLTGLKTDIENISESELHDLVLRQISQNRTARKSLMLTLRFLRDLDAEAFLENEHEIRSQSALLAQIKAFNQQ